MSDNKVMIGWSWPFLSVLFFIFLVLKLTGHITWSWLWVTAPLWGIFAFVLLVILVLIVLMSISKVFGAIRRLCKRLKS